MDKESFDESKVKRDSLGRFAEMTAKEISNEIKIEIGSHKLIIATKGRVPRSALTSNQWRLWYQEQTQREKSYLLCEIEDRRFVDIEGVFVLTNSSFDKPEVEAIYDLKQDSKIDKFKKLLEEYYNG